MMRVAHLLPNMAIGGRERIVQDLCRSASRHGIDPIIIAYDTPAPGTALLDVSPIQTIHIDRRTSDFASTLRSELATHAVDLLHAHGHVAAVLAHRAGLPMPWICTLHIALGTGWRWFWPVMRALRSATVLTAVSADLARRYGRICGRKIAVIPTGVDLQTFRPDPEHIWHIGAQPLIMGTAARLHPVKRQRDLLEAVRIVAQHGLSLELWIAGEGEALAALQRAAVGLDVRFLGAVQDMPAFYRSIDMFALVSDHEGSPAALLEAMACSLPCIVTGVGGIPDIVGNAAAVVRRRRPMAIAGAIMKLAADRDAPDRLGAAAAERARSFDAEISAGHYAAMYREMLTA